MSQIMVRLRDAGGVNSPAGRASGPDAFIAITRRGSGAGWGPAAKRLVNGSGAGGMAARYIFIDIARYRIESPF
jgi:hypothetical protein